MVPHQKIGGPIVVSWMNPEPNQFISVRTSKDQVELEAKALGR